VSRPLASFYGTQPWHSRISPIFSPPFFATSTKSIVLSSDTHFFLGFAPIYRLHHRFVQSTAESLFFFLFLFFVFFFQRTQMVYLYVLGEDPSSLYCISFDELSPSEEDMGLNVVFGKAPPTN